jgi:hypothetical protein
LRQSTSPSAVAGSWSSRIEARYRCALSEDLIRWFDDEVWQSGDTQQTLRYTSPIAPQDLLVDAPTAIWPALMPCDFLPLIGNQMGDWLCLRIDDGETCGQIVQWYHGGGDWIPWGDSLAEAIFFDSVRDRLPGSQRDHAVSATLPEPSAESGAADELARWANDQLRERQIAELSALRGDRLARAMLQRELSSPAVLCQLVIDALNNPLLTPQRLREQPRVLDAQEVQRWLFDNRLMPSEVAERLAESPATGRDVLAQQDWEAVERYSRQATEAAPELAWGWDLLGYVCERRGDVDEAVRAYRSGIHCSIFTDQTVRVRTHGFSGEDQKFSAARLQTLDYLPEENDEREYFRLLCDCSDEQRRDRVREFFADRARQTRGPSSHDLWKRAGWDLGAEPMAAFAELLEQVAATAADAGRPAQAALAQTHRNCFRDRYGL